MQIVAMEDTRGRIMRFKCTRCRWIGEDVAVTTVKIEEEETTVITFCPECGKKAVPDYDM
jgi:hypothetical protein